MSVLTTFEAFAARAQLNLLAWEARVGGMVDRTEQGLAFKKFTVEIDMEVSDTERARAVLEETRCHHLMTNALRAPIEIEARIRSRERSVG